MAKKEVGQLDSIFAALANGKRRSMVYYLALQPATIAGLARVHSLTLPAMHKHVKTLEESGLLQRKKVGRVNFVALNKSALRQAQDWLRQYRTYWGNDQQALTNYIARMCE